jgi:hypothetical protein
MLLLSVSEAKYFLRGSGDSLTNRHPASVGRKVLRGVSSVGRAPAWHAGGQRFESATLHFPI